MIVPATVFSLGILAAAASQSPAVAGRTVAGGEPVAQESLSAAQAAAAAPRISVDELMRLRGGERPVVVVDVRTNILGAMIARAVHVPPAKLAEWAATAPKDAIVVTYCSCRDESIAAAATAQLRSLGFVGAFALRGGLQAWIDRGFPTAPPPE